MNTSTFSQVLLIIIRVLSFYETKCFEKVSSFYIFNFLNSIYTAEGFDEEKFIHITDEDLRTLVPCLGHRNKIKTLHAGKRRVSANEIINSLFDSF